MLSTGTNDVGFSALLGGLRLTCSPSPCYGWNLYGGAGSVVGFSVHRTPTCSAPPATCGAGKTMFYILSSGEIGHGSVVGDKSAQFVRLVLD